MNAEAKQHGGAADTRANLLIADDDMVCRIALTSQLEPWFHVVAVAESATEAIELADKHRPDVALVDVQMPGGGAREAVPGIATSSPDTRIVVLSSDESARVVLELLEAGAIAYMRKGATGAEIAKTLTDALGVTPHQRQAWTMSRSPSLVGGVPASGSGGGAS
jgi:DNA-binding NarL/FixJ family response regulator